MKLVRFLYRVGSVFMWAFVTAWAVYAVVGIMRLPWSNAERQRARIDALVDENRYYCTRWGFAVSTPRYTTCVLDLDEIRQKEDERSQYLGFGF